MGWTQAIMSIVAIVTLGIGVYLNQKGTNDFRPTEVEAPAVLSESTDATPSPSPSPTITPSPTPSATPSRVDQLKQPHLTETNLSEVFYPSASIISTNNTSSTLASSDDPETIFNWYRNKFNELGFNAKSTSKTNTNNNFYSKMAGAKNDLSIQVEIKRNAGENKTSIVVNKN